MPVFRASRPYGVGPRACALSACACLHAVHPPFPLGQLNLYLSAVDDLVRHPTDGPTIGLRLWRGKNRIKAEYALRGLHRPIGFADWETQLVESLPDDLAAGLPSVEEIERELSAPDE